MADIVTVQHRILITGPESSGKSSLAAALAQAFATTWVPEYARTYLTALDCPYVATDLPLMLRGQLALEAAATAPLLFCDTGPEVIYVWSRWQYGCVAAEVRAALLGTTYHHTLLCYPDLPWEPDPLREAPAATVRLALFGEYTRLLDGLHRPYTIVRGADRSKLAQQAVTDVLPHLQSGTGA